MAETHSSSRPNILRLILVPSVITLAITVLRLVGERNHWSETLFNTSAGGAGSLIGITWLAPIFGIYFALKLAKAGQGPASTGRAITFAVIGFVLMFGSAFLTIALKMSFYGRLISFSLATLVAALIQYPAWPALFKTLMAYGYAARIPVAVIMWFAMAGNWGTHYDAAPPDLPSGMGLVPKYFWIGLIPQFVLWIGFTIIIGALFGSVAAALARRRKPETQMASA